MKKELWLAIALAAYAAARVAPPVADLTEASQAALAVTIAGTILWISEAVPLGVTALLVVVLLAINPGMRLPDALHGFTSEVTFFLVGVAAIGIAVEASGLAQRAARFLARSAKGNPTRLYVQMIVSLPALAFLVPSAITRNAILIPAYREALDSMGVGKSGRVGRALMLALGMLNPLASSALLTGGIASIAAATLLGGFSWLGWFALMAVPYYALIFLGGIWLRMMVGPFESGGPCSVKAIAEPLSTGEIKTLVILAATALLWLTDAWHHLSPAIPALMAAIVLLIPRIGSLTWKQFESKLSWGLILTVGASMSLAHSMIDTGAAAWLGAVFVDHVTAVSVAPMAIVVLLVITVALVHLAITNLAACMALLIPIAVTIAQAAHLNPLVCGLIVTIAVDAVILYPVQTAANLLAYEAGYFPSADVRRLGLGMLVLTIAVALLVLPYWSLLGLPLVPT
ncbi:SLC13 family permease [Reyranella soli]|uniref:Sodium/dicarboxylate or sulfate cotransporter n=1 Tax=Reyranella soli TaxID=1230389 RepID=A0A512N3Y2_9HYPH|nr:SLC13 family permease [Reyranella soli]GEP53698.1 sodium/dicarboxylate or sulfate cotransporter [Reyranella soli]